MTNNYSEQYPTIEIDWKPALDNRGDQIMAKDGTPILVAEPMVLTPKHQGQYGGWAFEDIDGFWSIPQGAPPNVVQLDVPVLVTLSLGGKKSTGDRYKNMYEVKPAPVSQAATQRTQETSEGVTSQPSAVTSAGIDRDSSIREQAMAKAVAGMHPEIFAKFLPAQQVALLSATFDSLMLMMRPVVRKRAQEALLQEGLKEFDKPAKTDEPEKEENVETLTW